MKLAERKWGARDFAEFKLILATLWEVQTQFLVLSYNFFDKADCLDFSVNYAVLNCFN